MPQVPTDQVTSKPDGNRRALLPVLVAKTMRDIADRSKRSEIGYVMCPRTNIAIKSESGTEHNAILYCYADTAVERVLAQSARVYFTDAEGERHHHTLDIRAKRFDGHVHGLLVKPDSKAVEMDLRGFTKRLAAVTPKAAADDLNYVSERDMPEFGIRNAAAMLTARRERRTDVDIALSALAPTIEDDITIGDLCLMLGGGLVGFRPVVRAIFYGTLECVTEGLIEPSTIVRFSGTVMPDLDADGPIHVRGLAQLDGAAPKPPRKKPGSKHHSYRSA